MHVICEAISKRLLLEFTYNGLHRVVAPYCHGVSTAGHESLRGVQVGGESRSRGMRSGKLWTLAKMTNARLTDRSFRPDDPNYNPDDSGMKQIHCRV